MRCSTPVRKNARSSQRTYGVFFIRLRGIEATFMLDISLVPEVFEYNDRASRACSPPEA